MVSGGKSVGGFALLRNPGVAMLWTCKDYFVYDDGRGGKLIQMGEPEHVRWYARARLATREEVMASVESGYPNLVAIAKTEKGAMEELGAARKRFERYLP